MELIHFTGLNCYFNCLVSVAAAWGLNYAQSFATLWSETDLFYDERYHAYSTKRMLVNLEAMGLKLDNLTGAARPKVAKGLSLCPEGGFIMVGMDAFAIPWSPIYRALHDPHHFLAKKKGSGSWRAFDPTYNKKNQPLSEGDILAQAHDIRLIVPVAKQPVQMEVAAEAQNIVSGHARTREKLLRQINECGGEQRQAAGFLARYTGALINNRYLFQHYLHSLPPDATKYQQLFDQAFFGRWEAVKNGLYKASLLTANGAVLAEVGRLADSLIDEEIAMAQQILTI